ncbi:hypothetical protein MC7420_1697 [Coleofasciculus chthonoplastes PCC 7420]|uniref:Uncharacterized protein n=1 Tax=Coleofasciculus chthonoplastes PCC 7420 TaxID=118168 RepID=B4VMJ8_9CYAN|nr:hypothetical protein MC7420_1697 [Coleofasciculus chthonoplastes PCC 7420]
MLEPNFVSAHPTDADNLLLFRVNPYFCFIVNTFFLKIA